MTFPVHTVFTWSQTVPIPPKQACTSCGMKWAQGKSKLCRTCQRAQEAREA